MNKPIVIKIGGSTFGKGETVIEDIVALQKEGFNLVVFHGGGNEVTSWLKLMGIETEMVDGQRVTSRESLRVVVAVLAGLVNKEIVAQIQAKGGRAVGLCGVDGRILESEVVTPTHGLVGEVVKIDTEPLEILLDRGYMPVIAPPSYGIGEDKILNVNGDPAAGALAAALGAERLVMLTDVDGVMDGEGRVLGRLSRSEAEAMIESGVAAGGMIPKVRACLSALESNTVAQIVDGRVPHALLDAVGGKDIGTIIE
ncbi:MAG: acetylglutamate kinase [Chloroflexota bacterium]|nr:acetylglutamate kinase [Chloroflexota bacterium]